MTTREEARKLLDEYIDHRVKVGTTIPDDRTLLLWSLLEGAIAQAIIDETMTKKLKGLL